MRKYRRLRAVLLTCILGAFATLVPTAWLFFRSGSSQTARAIAVAVFIELAVSAAVLGAFALCPVCRARMGAEPRRRCPRAVARAGLGSKKAPAVWNRGAFAALRLHLRSHGAN
jgi:hypothetical protein